jgi:hypothetical protein
MSFRQKEIRVIQALKRAGLNWVQIADGLGKPVHYIIMVGRMKAKRYR